MEALYRILNTLRTRGSDPEETALTRAEAMEILEAIIDALNEVK